MKKLVIPLMLFIVIGQSFSYQIAWKKKFDENVGFKFSRDGNEVLIRKSSGFEIYDRVTGSLKRSNDSLSFEIISDDFNFGLIRTKDTINIYNTKNNTLISQIIHSFEYDSLLSKYSRYIISPDNKYLIIAVTLEGVNDLKHIKSEGWLDVFDLTSKNPDKPIKRIGIDTFGSIRSIFFDRTDSVQLYLSDMKYDIKESDSTITKNIYRYDFSKDQLFELYSLQSIFYDYTDLYYEIRAFPTNPYGCAVYDDNGMYIQFSILYPHKQEYIFEEGGNIIDYNMLNFTRIIAVIKDFSSSNCKIGFMGGSLYPNGSFFFGNSGFDNIYTFETNGNAITSVNAVNDWFCLYISGSKELLMFADSIKTVVDDHNQVAYVFSISPNPATDFIEISKPSEGSANAVKIFNVFGEIVSTSVCSADTSAGGGQKIDVSGLPSGVYFVRVGDKVGKFVKI